MPRPEWRGPSEGTRYDRFREVRALPAPPPFIGPEPSPQMIRDRDDVTRELVRRFQQNDI